jgi:hypothetical protein
MAERAEPFGRVAVLGDGGRTASLLAGVARVTDGKQDEEQELSDDNDGTSDGQEDNDQDGVAENREGDHKAIPATMARTTRTTT